MYVYISKVSQSAHVLDVNRVVNLAVGLEDEQTRVLHELVLVGLQEVVVGQGLLARLELLFGGLKVKIDVQRLQELRHGVLESVRLLVDHAHQFFQVIALLFVDHHRGGEVAQNVRARGLNGVHVSKNRSAR